MQTPSWPSTDPRNDADLPLIDERVMNDWCDDLEQAEIAGLLARVPGECNICVTAIKTAIAANNLPAGRRAAHRLKGMASNLGAVRLAKFCRNIELSGQSVEDLASELGKLEITLTDTLAALQSRNQ